jgi:hypothetical protein
MATTSAGTRTLPDAAARRAAIQETLVDLLGVDRLDAASAAGALAALTDGWLESAGLVLD